MASDSYDMTNGCLLRKLSTHLLS